jgi:hypothetical protein
MSCQRLNEGCWKGPHLLANILCLSVPGAHAPPSVVLRFLWKWLSSTRPRLSDTDTRSEEHPDMSSMRRGQGEINQVPGTTDVWLEGRQREVEVEPPGVANDDCYRLAELENE